MSVAFQLVNHQAPNHCLTMTIWFCRESVVPANASAVILAYNSPSGQDAALSAHLLSPLHAALPQKAHHY